MGELIAAAQGSPLLLLSLTALGGVLYAAERVFALSGPITRVIRWWHGRELAHLRREADLRSERRRLALADENAVIADLRAQLADLSVEVMRLRGAVRIAEAHHTRVKDWADGLLRAARAAGLAYVDPPSTDPLPVQRIPTPIG